MLFILVLISLQLSAQIENEIKQFVDSSEIIINNGRKLLIKSLVHEDLDKANEIYSFLINHATDGDYLTFSYTEDLYLNLIFGNYSSFIDKALNYKTIYRKYQSIDDANLLNICSNVVDGHFAEMEKIIHEGKLSAEDEALLNVVMLLFRKNFIDEDYSRAIKAFKKDFPDSRYKNFVVDFLPKPLIHGAISFGMGVSYLVPTGNLAESFYATPAFNMTYDINFGRIFTSLYMQGGGLELKKPFTAYNDVDTVSFQAGDPFSYFEGGLLVGYFLSRSEKMQLAPFVGFSGASLESNIYKDPNYNDYEIPVMNSFVVGLGLHTEFKLYDYQRYNLYGYSEKGYFSLKLDGGVNLVVNQDHEEFRGNLGYVRATLVWGLGKF